MEYINLFFGKYATPDDFALVVKFVGFLMALPVYGVIGYGIIDNLVKDD